MKDNETLKKVRSFIDTNFDFDFSLPVIVGLSGGADSVALLDILCRLGYKCIAVHCNFGLRGEESVRDRNFASEIALRLNIPFHETVFDTLAYAKYHKVSIEMACRELRYDWFERIRKETGASYIAVAHHRDDSVETVLLNLIRGTGIAGLTGINAKNGFVVRPLLCLSRLEIDAYLRERHLSYVTDSTNKEDIYTRNKIRLQVLPLLKSINPAIYDTIGRTASNMRETEIIYRDAIERQKKEVVEIAGEKVCVSIENLNRQPSPRTLLYEILSSYGFLPSQLDDIIRSLGRISGKEFYSPSCRLLKDREYLIITSLGGRENEFLPIQVDRETTCLTFPLKLTFNYISDRENFVIPTNKMSACFDVKKLVFPLEIRHWKKGDRFTPFGMKGSKKLSDYFNDRKYSRVEKENAWLLCSGNDIIWLIGERMSEKYKIDCETTLILNINYEI